MPDVKISQLPLATSPLDGTVEMPVVQGGTTKRAPVNTIGFLQPGTGAVARTVQDKLRESVSVKDFGAVGDGVANDTPAIQAALDAVFSGGGGTLYFPPGAYAVTSIVKLWDQGVPVSFRGAGRRNTAIIKFDNSTTPLFDLSATLGVLETYSSISDIQFRGNAKANHGLRLTNWARFDISRVQIDTCDVGIENLGSLVFSVYDPTIQGNNIGYRSRLANGVRANLVNIIGGIINSNTTLGLDVGDASGVQVIGTDISFNGTAADTATGGVLLRSTIDDEFGFSSFLMRGCWFEGNLGWQFRSEACAGLLLNIDSANFISSESGRAVDIASVYSARLNNIVAGGPSEEVTIAAVRSHVSDSVIATLTDTSTRRVHVNIGTFGPAIFHDLFVPFRGETLGSSRVLFGRKDQISGGNSNDYEFSHPDGAREFVFSLGGANTLRLSGNQIGFYGTAPAAKPTITGSRGGNAALADLLTQLATLGLITDNTTA